MITYESAVRTLEARLSRNPNAYAQVAMGGATNLRKVGDVYQIEYNGRKLVEIFPDGSRKLYSGGVRSETTKNRLTTFGNIRRMRSIDSTWYAELRSGDLIKFVEGLHITVDGGVNRPGTDMSNDEVRRLAISRGFGVMEQVR